MGKKRRSSFHRSNFGIVRLVGSDCDTLLIMEGDKSDIGSVSVSSRLVSRGSSPGLPAPPPPPPPLPSQGSASSLRSPSPPVTYGQEDAIVSEDVGRDKALSRYDSTQGPEPPPFDRSGSNSDRPKSAIKSTSEGLRSSLARSATSIAQSESSAENRDDLALSTPSFVDTEEEPQLLRHHQHSYASASVSSTVEDDASAHTYRLSPPLLMSTLPEQTQQVIASCAVEALSASTSSGAARTTLPSPGHLQWAMQCASGIFSLRDYSDETLDVVQKALRMLQSWLLSDDEKKVPPYMWEATLPVQDTDGSSIDQQFVVAACKHMCLLFEPRPALAKELHKRYLNLCMLVLDTILALCARRKDQMTPATWKSLMRTLVRASRIVLLGNKKKSILVDGMSSEMARVLLEVFLRSHVKEKSLWKLTRRVLQEALYDNKQSAVARQWRAMMLGLTRRMLDILWPTQGDATVLINWETRRRNSPMCPFH